MELLQLKYFYESALSESFAKTAEKYMVPTTSVSASVKRLEKELGCPLFERYANHIKLNEEGKSFLKSISSVLNELEHAVVDISQEKSDRREIKMLVRAMRDDITDYVIRFRREYPDIAFKITLDFKESDFKKYDIIIDEKSGRHPDYESFELQSMKLSLMASDKNPISKKALTMADLKNESFVSWGEESNMHRILVNACFRAGFAPDVAVMTNDMKCHDKLIAYGIGIGLAREGAAKDGMTALDISDFNETYTVCTYYKKDAAYGNVKAFLE